MQLRLPALLALTLLAACAQVQVYVPPAHDARAALRFAPAIYAFGYLDNGDDCTGARRLNDAENPFKRQDRTLELPASRRIALNLFAMGKGLPNCSVVVSFVLQGGGRYEAQMTMFRDGCVARIVEAGKDPEGTAAAIALRRVNPSTCAALQ